jgi:hypothetical protein
MDIRETYRLRWRAPLAVRFLYVFLRGVGGLRKGRVRTRSHVQINNAGCQAGLGSELRCGGHHGGAPVIVLVHQIGCDYLRPLPRSYYLLTRS